MGSVDANAVPSGYGIYFLQTLLALGAVCLLAFFLLRFTARRMHRLGQKGQELRIIENLNLDQRRCLYLVEVAGRRLLIGASEAGLATLADISSTTRSVDVDDLESVGSPAEVLNDQDQSHRSFSSFVQKR